MGRDLILLLGIAALVAVLAGRAAVDYLARRRHWRVGGWGRLLCIWRRVGDECLRCRTDYRYVLARPIRYTGESRGDVHVMIPLCIGCWNDTSAHEHLVAAASILTSWRSAGVYDVDGKFDREQWDADRVAVYFDVMAIAR